MPVTRAVARPDCSAMRTHSLEARLAHAGRAGQDDAAGLGTRQQVTQERELRRPPDEWPIRHGPCGPWRRTVLQ